MPCTNYTVTSFDYTTKRTAYDTKTVCWPDVSGGDVYRPPAPPPPASAPTPPRFDPKPSGDTIVVPDTAPPPPPPPVDVNPGWNSGAFSIDSVPADWGGTVSFDVPDVEGSRPVGVAVGFCPVSSLPTTYRNGYGHLRYGIVFTEAYVKIIHDGEIALTMDYADVNAERTAPGTDLVQALLYGDSVRWVVNGASLYGGPFSMGSDYALDAVLYLAYDRVDNPLFEEGVWPEDDGSLIGVLPYFTGSLDGLASGDLTGYLGALFGTLAGTAYCHLAGDMPALYGSLGTADGISGNIGPLIGALSGAANYSTMTGSIGPITGVLAGGPAAGLKYFTVGGNLPRFTGYMAGPATGQISKPLPQLIGRVTAETSYSELVGTLGGLRGVAYGGSMTPLVQVMETVGYFASSFLRAYLTITATEYVQATSTATVDSTVTADASEEVTVQDTASVFATMLEAVAERVGLGERVSSLVFRVTSGALVDDGQAWTVVTGSNATTRYDTYGFNSFATIGGKQYGLKANGLYLLEGDDDAGQPITAGVALGKHDFGTQALKSLAAVYVGVSSSGKMLLRVGDGKNTYTYMSRRADAELRVQRFDPGRGLRTNYFTFDLVGEGEAFELDNVTFNVAASNRKI